MNMVEPERILIFELNWMGDILFSFPFLRAIRKAFPEAYISCVVVPRYVDLLAHNPWINDVHALSDDNRISSIGEKLAFIRMIRNERYDTCFFLKSSATKAVMARLAGIPERIGFSGKKAPLTKEVEIPPKGLHRADQILSLAGVVGVERADGTYEYFISQEDKERADELFHEAGGGMNRVVAINPGGNWGPKRWPEDNFIKLTKGILASFEDVEIMITGAEKDTELADTIVKEVGSNKCYSLAGKTKLNEAASLFKGSELVISADSGPLHLASAAGATTIGLFGPTSHRITGQRGRAKNIVIAEDVDCEIPCYIEDCEKDYICMKKITVDKVLRAVKQVLGDR
ncbi:MAG: lipopolysaccharide heptosyltransferase II [Candidatus Omnitrophota bacterium]